MFTIRSIGIVTFIIAVGLAAFASAVKAPDTFPTHTAVELTLYGVLMMALINVMLANGVRRVFFFGQSVVLIGFFTSRLVNISSYSAFLMGIGLTLGDDFITDERYAALSVAHGWIWLLLSIAAGAYSTTVHRNAAAERSTDPTK